MNKTMNKNKTSDFDLLFNNQFEKLQIDNHGVISYSNDGKFKLRRKTGLDYSFPRPTMMSDSSKNRCFHRDNIAKRTLSRSASAGTIKTLLNTENHEVLTRTRSYTARPPLRVAPDLERVEESRAKEFTHEWLENNSDSKKECRYKSINENRLQARRKQQLVRSSSLPV